MTIIDNKKQRIDCAIVDAGLGTAQQSPGAAGIKTGVLEATYGPMSVIQEHGVHADGKQCVATRLIGWEALAVIVGVAEVLAESWPVHIRDQYQARVDQVHAEARVEFPRAGS